MSHKNMVNWFGDFRARIMDKLSLLLALFCNEMPLAVHGEITQSSALMCGVLSVGWQAQASCDRMLGSQQQGIKCRRFYYNWRSTIQLTLMFTSSPPSGLAMAPRLTSGSTG